MISSLRKSGPQTADLRKFKAEHQLQMETRLKDNQYWLNYLENQGTKGYNYDDLLKYDNIVQDLSEEDLKHCAEKFLNGANYLEFVLMPEKKE